jgi:hypothetical protein
MPDYEEIRGADLFAVAYSSLIKVNNQEKYEQRVAIFKYEGPTKQTLDKSSLELFITFKFVGLERDTPKEINLLQIALRRDNGVDYLIVVT